jgi:GxxExxY protein
MNVEKLAATAIDCGLSIHRELGQGLLESAYEAILAHELTKCGLYVECQKAVPIIYDGVAIDAGFRIDILVERQLVIELKSVERLAPVHGKQILTYLRFMNLPLGLLMNFGAPMFKDGLKRVVNGLKEEK